MNNKPNYISVMNYSYQNGIHVSSAPGVASSMSCASDADCNTGVCATPNACHCTDDLGSPGPGNFCYRVDYSDTKLLDLKVPEGMLGKFALLPRLLEVAKFPPRIKGPKAKSLGWNLAQRIAA